MKIRSPKHLRYVASQDCCVCGWWDETVVPHHLLRAGGKGMGTKACDSKAVPLHHDCHQELHLYGDEVEWFALNGEEYEDIIELAKVLSAGSPDKRIREGK